VGRSTARLIRCARLAAVFTAGTLTLSACGFHGLYSVSLPGGANLGSHPYSVTVEFADVLDLVPQSAVKVNDVTVGKVDSISLDGWLAKVKLTVNGDVSLPENSLAQLQQTSLLGEKFVQLERPTSGASGTLENGDNIPLSHTGRNTEVEEVLGALSLVVNGGGLSQIGSIVHELDQALDGHQTQARDLLTQLNSFVKTLDDQKARIVNAIQNVDTLAVTLNKQKQVIVTALDTLPAALAVLAGNRQQLVSLLNSLSALGGTATAVIDGSQQAIVSSLKNLAPVATALTSTGANLVKSLDLLTTFPFPQQALTAVHGDYVNANLNLDLNLTDALNGLFGNGAGTGGASASSSRISSAATVPSASQSGTITGLSIPTIPGLGR
jgi:phospholipid/cholesterol/gamma-HCH transport system substrate-binding protein